MNPTFFTVYQSPTCVVLAPGIEDNNWTVIGSFLSYDRAHETATRLCGRVSLPLKVLKA